MFRLVHKIPLVFGFQPCLEYKYVYIASGIVTNSICRFTRRPTHKYSFWITITYYYYYYRDDCRWRPLYE